MASKEEWLAKLQALERDLKCHLMECKHWDLQISQIKYAPNQDPQFPDKAYRVCPNCGGIIYI
jgi:hypothetical protein